MAKRGVFKNIFILSVVFLALAELFYHLSVPFQKDDMWYSTNLVTGEPLKGISDVFESQAWHYLNWGGRSVTHGFLQLVLMSGEKAAALLNVLVTLLLSYVISLFTDCREHRVFAFGSAFALMFCFNPDRELSMFWESGCVNYVYSSVWILFFLYLYISRVDKEDFKKPWGITFWIVPLGIIAGWSNENMGPSVFAASVGVILYLRFAKKQRIQAWMVLGSVFSFIGSAAMILAPGNFVRNQFMPELSFAQMISSRLFALWRAVCTYILPTALFLLLMIVYRTVLLQKKLETTDLFLVFTAVISFLAMFLSPAFPARAAFGINMLLLTAALRIASQNIIEKPILKPFFALAYYSSLIYSVCICLVSAIFFGGEL